MVKFSIRISESSVFKIAIHNIIRNVMKTGNVGILVVIPASIPGLGLWATQGRVFHKGMMLIPPLIEPLFTSPVKINSVALVPALDY